MTADWTGAIERARRHAPFLARQLRRFPDIAAALREGDGAAALAMARILEDGPDDTAVRLRRERSALALVLAVGDLAGAFPLEQVMGELSAMADRALDQAIAAAIARRVPDAAPTGFAALALGKHGSHELNYSSDIDPILLYDPDALPRRPRDEPGEAAQRYARDIVQMLAGMTAEGYVFRVDLRLRPASEVSPLALSFNGAMTHYEGSALAWERAAFIRARAAAGDVVRGRDFLAAIDSFVWRRSLDFGAIDEIRRLTRRIRERQTGPRGPAPGFNVKLGRGGIREVEFFAQTLQLIHGGRDPSLRVAGTRAALEALASAGLVEHDLARTLAGSYEALRVVEHRLQMVEDHQTHTLPAGAALDNAARLGGWADGAALLAHLAQVCAPVAAAFDALMAQGDDPAPLPLPSDEREDPHGLAARIAAWDGEQFRVLRSEAAIQAFEAIRPQLVPALLAAPDPERAVARMEALLGKLPTAINMFRLLEARPALFELLVRVLALAPPLAERLGRRPELLDPLIDRSAFDLPGTVEDLARRMRRAARDDSLEARLDGIRIVTGEVRFALGVQLIEAAHDPLAIGAGLARLADAGLQVAQDAATEAFAEAHGHVPEGELVVLGLGRVGGRLLTHASDLDLVYLFTGPIEQESTGKRPLGTTLYFNRLAQRVSAALSVPTAEGALYEVDTRLRPQGVKGPLAVSVDSFRRYQGEEAWTWEHMALTRARVVTGSADARRAVEAVIADTLARERDPATLAADVLAMREEMVLYSPPAGPLDTKRLRGGLIDQEFLIHYLQLRERGFFDPDLAQAIGRLVAAGLLEGNMAEAHGVLNKVLIAARLLAPDLGQPHPSASERLARACGMEDYDALMGAVADARACVAREWRRHLEEDLVIA